jgi:hypothetical protein
MHRKVAAAIVAALTLAVASCGGSEKTTLDRAQLVRRVELACNEAQDTWRERFRVTRRSDRSLRDGQRLLVERLEELEASGDAKDDFNTYKEGVRIRFDALQKILATPVAERPRVTRSLQKEAEAAMQRGTAAARRLGIEGC